MPNSYFRFKQFTVHQQYCAMKICTDACLFGAWLAQHTALANCTTILDIGTGTGLLPLLLAQQLSVATIEALEIDEAAANQAAANFRASGWSNRLQVIHTDARVFSTHKKYELVVCNPPFFENDVKSVDTQRNLALHSAALRLEEVLTIAKDNCSEHGLVAFLLPFHRCSYFENLAAKNSLYLTEKLLVRQTTKHSYFRAMLLYSQTPVTPVIRELTIKDETNQYSAAFVDLLKPYYLKL